MGKNNENKKISFLFLVAIANLLAAFGGGTVLNQAIALAIDKEAFKIWDDGALIAFMIGTTIGLVLLGLINRIKSKWSRASRMAGGYLSFAGAVTAILLAVIYQFHLQHTADGSLKFQDLDLIAFYFLLSLLFSLLFLPRILRSDATAGDERRLGLVEFCYAVGVVLGLVSWTKLTSWLPNIEFETVLYFDAGFQILAGLLDLSSSRRSLVLASHEPSTPSKSRAKLPLNWGLYTKITIAVVALTIGTQIVAFEFRLALGESLGIFIMGSFYFGAALSALMYSTIKTNLEFTRAASYVSSFGVIVVRHRDKKMRIPLLLASGLTGLLLLLAVAGNAYRLIWVCPGHMTCLVKGCTDINLMYCPVVSNLAKVMFVLLITVAAFLYEWITLVILDLIGAEAKEKNRERLVALTFGLMGIGAAMSIFFLSLFKFYIPGHLCWAVTLIGCLIITNLAVGLSHKRALSAATAAG